MVFDALVVQQVDVACVAVHYVAVGKLLGEFMALFEVAFNDFYLVAVAHEASQLNGDTAAAHNHHALHRVLGFAADGAQLIYVLCSGGDIGNVAAAYFVVSARNYRFIFMLDCRYVELTREAVKLL